ncbi:hypothetical protein FKM82_001938 [Ascaphus truei]
MDLEMEEAIDFKSLRAKFQGLNSSNTLPLSLRGVNYRVEKAREANVSNINSNPKIRGVVSMIETNAETLPFLKKPALAPKPIQCQKNCISSSFEASQKESVILKDTSHTNSQVMRLNKTFKHTLHILDSTRKYGDGKNENLPEKYIQFPNINYDKPRPVSTPPESQWIPEEYYETADPFPAWNDHASSSNDSSSMSVTDSNSSDLTAESTQSISPYNASKGKTETGNPELLIGLKPAVKRNPCINNIPNIKSLPYLESLGLPPQKPPRPPTVDLSIFLTPLSKNNEQVGLHAETEYDASLPGPAMEEGECYEDVLQGKESSACKEISVKTGDNTSETTSDWYYEVSLKGKALRSISVGDAGRENQNTENAKHQSKAQTNSKEKVGRREQTLRNKFQLSGFEEALYKTQVLEDCKSGRNMLQMKKGDIIGIIQITDCPMGKWLAKNDKGHYGYVPVASVEMDKDILVLHNQTLRLNETDVDVYDDVERTLYEAGAAMDNAFTDSSSGKSELTYDNISNGSISSNTKQRTLKGLGTFFKKDKGKNEDSGRSKSSNPNLNDLELGTYAQYYDPYVNDRKETGDKHKNWRSMFLKSKEERGKAETVEETQGKKIESEKRKKFAKEERLFREKFQYTEEIVVINTAVVNALAPHSRTDKLQLPVKPGEELEIIDVVTRGNLIICRNSAGKFGHVMVEHLNFKSAPLH